MSKKNNNVPFLRTHIVGRKGGFTVQFWIGVQGFTIQDHYYRRSKKEAEWLKAMLDIAFKNLENKHVEVLEMYKDLLLYIVEDIHDYPILYAKQGIWAVDVRTEIQVVKEMINSYY